MSFLPFGIWDEAKQKLLWWLVETLLLHLANLEFQMVFFCQTKHSLTYTLPSFYLQGSVAAKSWQSSSSPSGPSHALSHKQVKIKALFGCTKIWMEPTHLISGRANHTEIQAQYIDQMEITVHTQIQTNPKVISLKKKSSKESRKIAKLWSTSPLCQNFYKSYRNKNNNNY